MARTSQRTPEQEQLRYAWISTTEAARRIGGATPVTNDHVLALVQDGELEARDVSRKDAKRKEYRINPASVDAFLKRRHVAPRPKEPQGGREAA